MNVLITGGLGFVGTQLSIRLLERGHQVTVVDRSPKRGGHTPQQVKYVPADTTVQGPWQDEVARQDAVINLAGASIFRRWDPKTKQLISDSRVLTTGNIVEAISHNKRSRVLCSTSAVGYYGFRGDERLSEKDSPGTDFLAQVCIDWEDEAKKAADKGARVVVTRFGIVLGKTGGALGQMIPAFKKFAGGPLGSGKQWFSWIHMEDLVNAFMFVFDNEDIHGPVNFCSPNPIRNKDLAKALGATLSRPSFLKTPAFMLRLVLGEFGSVLLEGQRVFPTKLLKHGFLFRHPEIKEALEDLLKQRD
ncbi:MAG: TIGR01777 family oxidoreductase [Thermodesulfobacteriota bacterium]|nr:TIGR01777 family oxidoreductase [Thermodesulfobacteriota bacterium]